MSGKMLLHSAKYQCGRISQSWLPLRPHRAYRRSHRGEVTVWLSYNLACNRPVFVLAELFSCIFPMIAAPLELMQAIQLSNTGEKGLYLASLRLLQDVTQHDDWYQKKKTVKIEGRGKGQQVRCFNAKSVDYEGESMGQCLPVISDIG